MKRIIGSVVFSLLGIARVALAYEYPLQFTPNPGYRGLIVAGYKFDSLEEIVGQFRLGKLAK